MNGFLASNFTTEEISNAVRGMHPMKAPGEDGLPALFYQHFWHIIGMDVTNYCLNILNDGGLLEEINHTNIVLILKKANPVNMTYITQLAYVMCYLRSLLRI